MKSSVPVSAATPNSKSVSCEPDLIFDGGEVALLFAGDGGGLGIESVEADVGIVGLVVEESGVEDVLGGEIILETKEIVAGPIFRGVGSRRQLFDESEGVLEADGIRKPEAAANDGAGESESADTSCRGVGLPGC